MKIEPEILMPSVVIAGWLDIVSDYIGTRALTTIVLVVLACNNFYEQRNGSFKIKVK